MIFNDSTTPGTLWHQNNNIAYDDDIHDNHIANDDHENTTLKTRHSSIALTTTTTVTYLQHQQSTVHLSGPSLRKLPKH